VSIAAPTTDPTPLRPTRRRVPRPKPGLAPPVLVEVLRERVVESRHRGHVVQVDAAGELARAIGDPGVVVAMRSTVKPFGVIALIESGAADELSLSAEEIAIMAGSHAGEDKHVRTLQSVFRRANLSQSLLACGSDGMPLDRRTALRLGRDNEVAGPLRHMCSGYHLAHILLSRQAGWPLEDYTDPEHRAQVEVRATIARLLGRRTGDLVPLPDDCGLLTYAVPLIDVARGFLLLADPEGVASDPSRARSVAALLRVRDAMTSAPDMVGGTYEVLDTDLMRRRPGQVVAKSGSEGLRGVGLVPAPRARGPVPAGVAISIEDGDAASRASRSATVEALAQIGSLDELDLRALAAYHRPVRNGPDGAVVATSVPRYELAPLAELI
jgi:L-asparaginase II